MNRNKPKFKMYLGDITHTANGITSEFTPLGVGYIMTHFENSSPYAENFELSLFKFPEKFIERVQKEVPDVLALSNYIWNSDLSLQLAKEVKNLNPNALIILGGPNFHIEDHLREKWLLEHPFVDFHVIGEGEEPLCNVVNKWYEVQNIDQLKRMDLFGVTCLVDGKINKEVVKRHRISDLSSVPSPYLKGYMDDLLENEYIIPMVETVRGCPYSCSFCYDGSIETNKLKMMPVEKFKKEIEYIAKRTKSKVLIICDLNFGMLDSDIEVCKILAETKRKYNYPYYVSSNTAKNAGWRIKECVRILEGSLAITASVQSLDPEVLDNIRRKNISPGKLLEMAEYSSEQGANTRSEVILGLPGDTIEKHMNTMLDLVDLEMKFILPHNLIILQGAELGTDVSRKKWKYQTKFRLSHRSFGKYQFGKKEIRAAEIEEIVIGQASMSIEEYFDARAIDLTSFIFFSDGMLLELTGFLDHFGILPSKLFKYIFERKDKLLTEGLKKLYESFNSETRNELWNSKDELVNYIKSLNKMTYNKKIVGHNIMFKHRALSLIDLSGDIIDVAFTAARGLLPKNVNNDFKDYINELQLFSKFRKRKLFNTENIYNNKFNYDFYQLGEKSSPYKGIANKFNSPQELFFYYTEKQKGIIGSFPNDLNGVMRILTRVSILQTYRSVKTIEKKLHISDPKLRNVPIDAPLKSSYNF